MHENTNNVRRKRSVFTKKVRIRPSQLEYIRKLTLSKTLAGKLDIILNTYKEMEAEKEKQDAALHHVFREPLEVRIHRGVDTSNL